MAHLRLILLCFCLLSSQVAPCWADDWADEGVTDILPDGSHVRHGQLWQPQSQGQQPPPQYEPAYHQVQQQQQASPTPATHGYYRTNPDTGQPEFVPPTQKTQQPQTTIFQTQNQQPTDLDGDGIPDLYPTALMMPQQQQAPYQQQFFNDPLSYSRNDPTSIGSYGALPSMPQRPTNPGVPQKKRPIRDSLGDGLKTAIGVGLILAAIGGIGYGAYELGKAEDRRQQRRINQAYYNAYMAQSLNPALNPAASYSPYGNYNLLNTPYHWVKPHIRNGRAVGGYFATNPDGTILNNYSTLGNWNPWTGQPGYYWP